MVALSLLLPLMLASGPAPDPAAHAAEVETWRAGRLQRLKSDEGWLTVAGLYWLKPGANRFGSAADSAVKLPAHSAPARAGVLHLQGTEVSIEAAPGVKPTIQDKPVDRRTLKPDLPGPPDVVALGDARFFVIVRNDKVAVRLRDLRSPRRTTFRGIEHFPIRPEYRVVARYLPNPPGTTIKVADVLGGTSPMPSPGKLQFQLGGKPQTIDTVLEEPDDTSLFLIFKDQTAGKETYGAGRFVYTNSLPPDLGKPGEVVIDFNKAYNPPCAITPYSTCPLPPPQNRLKIRVEAGEKRLPPP